MRDASRCVQLALMLGLLTRLALAWLRRGWHSMNQLVAPQARDRVLRPTLSIAFMVAAACLMPLQRLQAAEWNIARPAVFRFNDNSDRLDPITAGCAQCHDGTEAQAVSLNAGFSIRPVSFRPLPRSLSSSHSGNHPVGIDYEAYALRAPRRLRPKLALPKAVHLVDGRISCISCHKLKPEEQANLDRDRLYWLARRECTASRDYTRPLYRSELCLTCHIK